MLAKERVRNQQHINDAIHAKEPNEQTRMLLDAQPRLKNALTQQNSSSYANNNSCFDVVSNSFRAYN